MPDGREPSEHLTFDLAATGVRLCGVPDATCGTTGRLLLYWPDSVSRLSGKIVRVDDANGRPEFAVQLMGEDDSWRETFASQVRAYLGAGESRCVAVLYDPSAPWWLATLEDRLHFVGTSAELVDTAAQKSLETIVAPYPRSAAELDALLDRIHLEWRTIGADGRLHELAVH